MATTPVRRRSLAAELRALREGAGLNISAAAKELGWAHSKLSRIEHAHRAATMDDVLNALDYYGIEPGPERERLIQLAREARRRGWWHPYRDLMPEWLDTLFVLETEAIGLDIWENEVIPGRFQTREYATALNYGILPSASEADVARRVELRMRRLDAVDETEAIWAVISETALRRPIGSAEVHVAQLDRLADLARRPNIDVQIMPFAAGAHPGLTGAFEILRFAGVRGGAPEEVAYYEHQGGAQFMDEVTTVEPFRRVMQYVRAQALDPAGSRAFIRQIRKELHRG